MSATVTKTGSNIDTRVYWSAMAGANVTTKDDPNKTELTNRLPVVHPRILFQTDLKAECNMQLISDRSGLVRMMLPGHYSIMRSSKILSRNFDMFN